MIFCIISKLSISTNPFKTLWSKKSITDMFKKRDILFVVCSAGGHLTEALLAIEGVDYPSFLVTYRLPHMEKSLTLKKHYYIINPHKSPWKYLINFFQSVLIYLRKRPRFIFSTGSGVAIATCLIGKLFGSKIIFLESGARIHSPSLTGRFLYHVADLFIVQWEPLLKHFPSAVFGGMLI
jgi:UDP-N-acetylglucosamine:LPS N-acetylglucosamine transferase